MLERKLIRDLWTAKGQYIAIITIIFLGVMSYMGLNSISRNLKTGSEVYYKDYRIADIEVTGSCLPTSFIRTIEDMSGTKQVTARVKLEARVNLSDINTHITMITLPDIKKDIVNDIKIVNGSYFTGKQDNECIVGKAFFDSHGLKIGDKLNYNIDGVQRKLVIVGSVEGPEFIYQLRDVSQILPDNNKYGVVYIKGSYAGRVLQWGSNVNSICVKLKEGTYFKAFESKLRKELNKFGTAVMTEKKEQLSYRMLESQLEELEDVSVCVPSVFFFVSLAIIYILISRMIEHQRIQIGVLKAVGCSDMRVLIHYLCYPVALCAAGILPGLAAGIIFGHYMTLLENNYFNVPLGGLSIYWDLSAKAAIISVGVSLLAGIFTCRKVFSILPADAMKQKAPPAGKKIIIEKFKLLWSRLDNNWEMIIRGIFRDKRRTIMTSAGIILSTSILIIGFGVNNSIDYMMGQYLTHTLNYDLKVVFKYPLTSNELEKINSLEHIKSIEPLLQAGIEISSGNIEKKILLTGVLPESQLYTAINKKGQKAPIPENGLLIPQRIAEDLNIQKGSSVKIKSPVTGGAEKNVIISGIVEQYMNFTAYGTIDEVCNILGTKESANSAVMKIDKAENRAEVEKELYKLPFTNIVETSEATFKNLRQFMGALSSFSYICILVAAALAIAVLYNISSISIFERKNEYATLFMLGYSDSEINRLIYNENYLLSFVSALIGLPAGYMLNMYVLGMVSAEEYTLPNTIVNFETYVMAIILIMFFTLMTNIMLKSKLKGLDLTEALKNRE